MSDKVYHFEGFLFVETGILHLYAYEPYQYLKKGRSDRKENYAKMENDTLTLNAELQLYKSDALSRFEYSPCQEKAAPKRINEMLPPMLTHPFNPNRIENIASDRRDYFNDKWKMHKAKIGGILKLKSFLGTKYLALENWDCD